MALGSDDVITFRLEVKLVEVERSHLFAVYKACVQLPSKSKIRSIYVTQVKTRERAF